MFSFNKLAALIISLFIILVAAYIFLNNLVRTSLPPAYENIYPGQIKDSVKVYRNYYGIPHIIAKNENDAFFMLGYCHAEDRLWQMDFFRTAGKGRLSEFFGKSTLQIDKFMRSLEIEKTAYEIEKSMNKYTLKILQAYSDGINFYIEKHINKLPFEFCVLDYTPEKWAPVDCIIIERLFALELSKSFWADISMGEIAEKIGPSKALELLPTYSDNAHFVLDSALPKESTKKKKDSLNIDSIKGTGHALLDYRFRSKIKNNLGNIYSGISVQKLSQVYKQLSSLMSESKNFLGFEGSSKGSNSWAMKKVKNEKTPAVLANDSHLALGLPSRWYQLHLTYPDFNIIGMTMPGIPFFFAGRNDYICWGMTNIMLDDCDFFIEKIDADTNYYFNSDGSKSRFKFTRDTIKIKNDEPYTYYRKYTSRSAVISDLTNISNPYSLIGNKNVEKEYQGFSNRYCLTYSWLGNRKSDEFSALYHINKAQHWSQFKDALDSWGVPAMNFTYGDLKGNIGLVPSGIIPLRGKSCQPQIPNPAWLPGYDWLGYKTLSDFPTLYNPSKMFVSSANNALYRFYPGYITSYWEPPSREQRIDGILSQYNEYSARDAQIMQQDIFSNYAKELLYYSVPLIQKDPSKLNELERQVLRRLKQWDYLMSQQLPSPLVFSEFFEKLLFNTFHDELGERLFNEYLKTNSVPTNRIMELVSDTISSHWFDNVNTPNYEDKTDIVLKSFKDAVETLRLKFRTDDINKWKFGKLHQASFNHILDSYKLIKPAINIGKFETGGSNTTINDMEWDLSNPYEVVLGPSMRFISDMSDTLVYTSIAGGISGDPFSDNYSNQVQLWLNGGYMAIPVSRVHNKNFVLKILAVPKKD